MALSKCIRCETLFDKGATSVCDTCLPLEEADYEKVRQGLQEHPDMGAEALAFEVGVDLRCILRFLESGRIETTAANSTVVCGRCGAPAISLSKRLCEACLHKLDSELTKQQGQIQLGKKKRLESSSAPSPSTSGVVKFQR